MAVSLLVVGAGNRGTAYADYALRHPEQARVVAVAEPRAAHRERFAELHGLDEGSCFADWRELPTDRIADVAIVATPDREHVAPAVALAAQGYSLLLEKPLATDEAGCLEVVEAVEKAGVVAAVAHVLRYTDYTRLLKEVVDSGAVGEVMSVDHLEPLGHWHHAHSYVRGNWRREDESAPMLLAKSSHDLDWLGFVLGRSCTAVSSFGELSHFRPDQRPEGAADRCLECALEPTCAYSAPRLYLGRVRAGELGWPVSVVAQPPTEESVREALAVGPYGRCVWACDNDVVDHQVLALSYEGGITATMTMTAFSRGRARETRVFGTRGELYGDGSSVTVYDFLTDSTTIHESSHVSDGSIVTGHGGGDQRIVAELVTAVATGDPNRVSTTPRHTLESHRVVFAAERARREGRVVHLDPS